MNVSTALAPSSYACPLRSSVCLVGQISIHGNRERVLIKAPRVAESHGLTLTGGSRSLIEDWVPRDGDLTPSEFLYRLHVASKV